jgi:hypothetical protein
MKSGQLTTWLPVATFVILVGGWAVTIETRLSGVQQSLDVSDRVANLERLLYPVLVEMEVRKRMSDLSPFGSPGRAESFEEPTFALPPVQEEAEEFVEGQMRRANPDFQK